MTNDDDWIAKRIGDAREAHPLVTDEATTRLKELLTGKLTEHQLTRGELSKTAKQLIEDMAPPSKAASEANHED